MQLRYQQRAVISLTDFTQDLTITFRDFSNEHPVLFALVYGVCWAALESQAYYNISKIAANTPVWIKTPIIISSSSSSCFITVWQDWSAASLGGSRCSIQYCSNNIRSKFLFLQMDCGSSSLHVLAVTCTEVSSISPCQTNMAHMAYNKSRCQL